MKSETPPNLPEGEALDSAIKNAASTEAAFLIIIY